MELLKQLHEASNRNEELKGLLTKAVDQAVEKYAKYLDGDKADQVKTALLGKFDPNLNKMTITKKLQEIGVAEGTGTASDMAQFILNQVQKMDAELSRSKA